MSSNRADRPMRTLGLIGGMSWVSSAEYYRLLNMRVSDRLGGLHSAALVMESVDFGEIEELRHAGQWDQIAELLAGAARRLESAGAEAVVLCTNTMHRVAPEIEAAISVPFLHIVDATATAVVEAGLSTVGLLGTAFTMEQSFYRDRLASHGLEVLVPDDHGRAEVSRIIYDELCHEVIEPASRAIYRKAMADLIDRGAEGIILGCTEIELLTDGMTIDVPTFATTSLHVAAAVDFALSDPSLR